MTTQGKSAFVTGGTGFVGSHLVEALQKRGYTDIRCLVRSDPKWLSGMDVTLVPGSFERPDELAESMNGVDVFFHVAGLTRSLQWDEFDRANVSGTFALLDVLRKVPRPPGRVLITSSLAAVGRADADIADEDTPFDPVSMYGRSKAMMEQGLAPYADDLDLVVIRPPAVYGPRDTDVLAFFQTVARGICPVVGGGSRPAVSLIHVSDLVRGMVDAAEHPDTIGRTYYIGSRRPYSWNEVRDAAAAVLERRVLTIPVPPAIIPVVGAAAEWAGRLFGTYPPLNREKAREIRHACIMCSSERAEREFGFVERIGLVEGVRETIAWYREQGWM